MGKYAGKGPKGWQRSDERLKDEINEALARHPDIDASDIEVQVKNGEVTLTGTVRDRETKRLAEDAAEQVFGANDVQNHLRVKPESATSTSDGATANQGGNKSGRESERSRSGSAAGATT
jgi:Flp pilus assembly secretin CpaC